MFQGCVSQTFKGSSSRRLVFFSGTRKVNKNHPFKQFFTQHQGKKTCIYIYPGSPGRLLIQWSFRKDHCFTRDLHQQFQGTIILMVFDLQGIYISIHICYIYIYIISKYHPKCSKKTSPVFFKPLNPISSGLCLLRQLLWQTPLKVFFQLLQATMGTPRMPVGDEGWLRNPHPG